MDRENKSTLLTKITAPQLTRSDYAKGIEETMENIQSNFNKLASLPFLQGADGADFEMVQKDLFVKDKDGEYIGDDGNSSITPSKHSTLSNYGKGVVYGILHLDGTSEREIEFNTELKKRTNLSGIYALIESYPDVARKYAAVSGVQVCDTMLKNNYLTCYVTKDDSGEEMENFVAQYYYHIDKRTSVVDTKSNVVVFEDASTFLAYDNGTSHTTGEEVFIRLNLVPSIYLNSATGKWCWKINGYETGVPANGIKGENGDAGSRCWIVNCQYTQEDEDKGKVLQTGFNSLEIVAIGTYEANEFRWSTDTTKINEIGDGDLCWVVVDDVRDPQAIKTILYTMGQAVSGADKKMASFHKSQEFSQYSTMLQTLLYGINNHTGGAVMGTSRGVFVPHHSHNGADITVVAGDTDAHTLFTSDGASDFKNETLNLGFVKSPIGSQLTTKSPQKISGGSIWPQFNIFYNVDIEGNIKGKGKLNITGQGTFGDMLTCVRKLKVNLDSSDGATISLGDKYYLNYLQHSRYYSEKCGTTTTRSVDDSGYNEFPAVGIGGKYSSYKLYVNGNTNINGDTQVNRLGVGINPSYEFHVNGNSYLGGPLTVTGLTTLKNNLNVQGDTSITGKLEVTGTSEFKNDVTFQKKITCKGEAGFRDNVNISGNLQTFGDTIFQNIDFDKNSIFDTFVKINNGLTLNGMFNVTPIAKIWENYDTSQHIGSYRLDEARVSYEYKQNTSTPNHIAVCVDVTNVDSGDLEFVKADKHNYIYVYLYEVRTDSGEKYFFYHHCDLVVNEGSLIYGNFCKDIIDFDSYVNQRGKTGLTDAERERENIMEYDYKDPGCVANNFKVNPAYNLGEFMWPINFDCLVGQVITYLRHILIDDEKYPEWGVTGISTSFISFRPDNVDGQHRQDVFLYGIWADDFGLQSELLESSNWTSQSFKTNFSDFEKSLFRGVYIQVKKPTLFLSAVEQSFYNFKKDCLKYNTPSYETKSCDIQFGADEFYYENSSIGNTTTAEIMGGLFVMWKPNDKDKFCYFSNICDYSQQPYTGKTIKEKHEANIFANLQ